MNIPSSILVLFAGLSVAFSAAAAPIAPPVLRSVSFDVSGRLGVAVGDPGPPGCYLSVNGGLSRASVTVPIIARRVTKGEGTKGEARLRTTRRYYCARRRLYVRVEKTCLGDVVGAARSTIREVTIPRGNLRP